MSGSFRDSVITYPTFFRVGANVYNHQYASSPPATRSDGSALQAGDRWTDTTDNTEWRWNGTYWLETIPRHINFAFASSNQATISAVDLTCQPLLTEDWYLLDYRFSGFKSGGGISWNSSNYIYFDLKTYDSSASLVSFGDIKIDNTTYVYTSGSDQVFDFSFTLNKAISAPNSTQDKSLYQQIRLVGSPTTTIIWGQLMRYRRRR